jgi:hypothetical protein
VLQARGQGSNARTGLVRGTLRPRTHAGAGAGTGAAVHAPMHPCTVPSMGSTEPIEAETAQSRPATQSSVVPDASLLSSSSANRPHNLAGRRRTPGMGVWAHGSWAADIMNILWVHLISIACLRRSGEIFSARNRIEEPVVQDCYSSDHTSVLTR